MHTGEKAEILYFPITVDSSLDFELKSVMLRFCSDSIKALRIQEIPQKHQVKIWIHMKASAFGDAMHAIITDVSGAELGPVKHLVTMAGHGGIHAA